MKNNYDFDFIINSLGRGGSERICVTLANAMAERGYNVRIITLRHVVPNYEDDIMKSITVKCLDASKDILGLIKLKGMLKRENISKIMAFDERISSICNYIKLKKHKNYYVISRVINNVDFQENENKKIIYKIMYKFSKKYFKYSDKYIFQCKKMMERMVKYFKLDEVNSKRVYIYNPLAKQFDSININTKKEDYFLMVGRLDIQKGYNHIFNVLKICKEFGNNINLKILGDGPLKNDYEEIIRKNKLNVELLGNVKNVIDYYKNAKALILTSLYEGFPNVLIEAIACGCPIISFDCPTGPSEIITKENGILVTYLNEKELANVILNFNKMKWDYKKVAETAIKYKIDNIIDTYIKEIE